MLDQGVGSLGRDTHGGDQLVAPPGVGVQVGVLGRDLDLTHDTLVGCGWAGVSFRWYCGVGGLVVGH